jgi:hypothetical protein
LPSIRSLVFMMAIPQMGAAAATPVHDDRAHAGGQALADANLPAPTTRRALSTA